eukprot:6667581-Prymnesium_polylepis.2
MADSLKEQIEQQARVLIRAPEHARRLAGRGAGDKRERARESAGQQRGGAVCGCARLGCRRQERARRRHGQVPLPRVACRRDLEAKVKPPQPQGCPTPRWRRRGRACTGAATQRAARVWGIVRGARWPCKPGESHPYESGGAVV